MLKIIGDKLDDFLDQLYGESFHSNYWSYVIDLIDSCVRDTHPVVCTDKP